jgi:hypothetical protein
MVWSMLRVFLPSLLPWHDSGVDFRGPYLGDAVDFRAVREAALPSIPKCAILSPKLTYEAITFVCKSGCPVDQHSVRLQLAWVVMLSCGMLTKKQWTALIYSGLKMPGFSKGDDLEASHLCGVHPCANPYHLAAKSHKANVRPTTCHRAKDCHCEQLPRCIIGQGRHADI